MEIDVRNFLRAEEGYKEFLDIKEEIEKELTEEATILSEDGRIELIALEDSILAIFRLKVRLRLVCVRCLENFEKDQSLDFEREYSFGKEQDKIEIGKRLIIDADEPIREESILGLPMKAICKEGCEGIK